MLLKISIFSVCAPLITEQVPLNSKSLQKNVSWVWWCKKFNNQVLVVGGHTWKTSRISKKYLKSFRTNYFNSKKGQTTNFVSRKIARQRKEVTLLVEEESVITEVNLLNPSEKNFSSFLELINGKTR